MAHDEDFLSFIDHKIAQHEALIGIDRISGACKGILAFSRTYNRITWMAVAPKYRRQGVGNKLLAVALRQLDTTREITVVTFCKDTNKGISAFALYQKFGFVEQNKVTDALGNPRVLLVRAENNEKRGNSFHYKYLDYLKYSTIDGCPACNSYDMPAGLINIAELPHSYVTAERYAQGRLFGKCHVMIKKHYIDLEDIPAQDMADFMTEVQ